MATIDVTSLYTSIPHAEGLSALKHFLDQRSTPHIPSTTCLVDLSEIILEHNSFSFNSKHFTQTRGCAMGSRFSPSYANLFLGLLEQSFLSSHPLTPTLWVRYIDDIFLLWPHGMDSLITFISSLNSFSSVNFTSYSSSTRVTFLDVDIFLSNSKFHTSVHIKSTNKQQYLHYNSCHPARTKRSLPFSLSIRGHRICNNPDSLNRFLLNLHRALRRRGYPESILRQKIRRKPYVPKQRGGDNSSQSLSLCTTFFPGVDALRKTIKDLFPVLSDNPTTSRFFPRCPSLVFKRPPNLASIFKTTKPLSKHSIYIKPQPSPCNRARCKTCRILITQPLPDKFITFPLPSVSNLSCTTKNIVYILLCQKCPAFYIGLSTTPLCIRMNGHRSSCNSVSSLSASLPVAIHASSHNALFDECYRVGILASLPPSSTPLELKDLEQACIWAFRAFSAPGINRAH